MTSAKITTISAVIAMNYAATARSFTAVAVTASTAGVAAAGEQLLP